MNKEGGKFRATQKKGRKGGKRGRKEGMRNEEENPPPFLPPLPLIITFHLHFHLVNFKPIKNIKNL